MSEKEKQLLRELANELPGMTERERGYLEGTIATAAAMSKRHKEPDGSSINCEVADDMEKAV